MDIIHLAKILSSKIFKDRKAFSLIELSGILTIMAIIAVGYISTENLGYTTNKEKIIKTREKIAVIENAIKRFRFLYGRLPCPALPNMAHGTSTTTSNGNTVQYNEEYGGIYINTSNFSTTYGFECLIDPSTSYNSINGVVPTKSLGLPDDYMYDEWGMKIRYNVASTLCGSNSSSAIPNQQNCTANTYQNNIGNLTIYPDDSAGATAITTKGAYVIISTGPNKRYGFTAAGQQITLPVTGTYGEYYNGNIIQDHFSLSGITMVGATTGTFDDIVVFATKQMIENSYTNPALRSVSSSFCTANSNAIAAITSTIASSMAAVTSPSLSISNTFTFGSSNGTSYANETGTYSYNSFDVAALDIMWHLQAICNSWYSTTKQCPSGFTYNSTSDSCICTTFSANGTLC